MSALLNVPAEAKEGELKFWVMEWKAGASSASKLLVAVKRRVVLGLGTGLVSRPAVKLSQE